MLVSSTQGALATSLKAGLLLFLRQWRLPEDCPWIISLPADTPLPLVHKAYH